MFERYTEKTRRAVFFARYEANQYGNLFIETEHLLLELLREDSALRGLLQDTRGNSEVRAEIERRIKRNLLICTSVEVPLSADCKKISFLAAEEADRLGHRHVGTEHMLLRKPPTSEQMRTYLCAYLAIELTRVRRFLGTI